MEPAWGYASAREYCDNWDSVYANRVLWWRRRTRNARRCIKKLQALMADPQVDLWASDEVHFQQHGSRCQMWIPPETKDPILLHHPTRRSLGYFGAVRLRDGKFLFHRETDKFNGATFFLFLKALYRTSTTGSRRVVVITDNARYHHARLHRNWREEHAERFVLDYLPPYSPDLNPIERVWKLTRRQCLHNRYFPLLSEVTDSVEAQFAQWASGNITLRRLCAIT